MIVSITNPEPLSFPRAKLTKVDLDGNILLEATLDDDQNDTKAILPDGISATADGGFVVYATDATDYVDYIYKTDANGNLLWVSEFDWSGFGGPKKVLEKPNGNLLVYGFYADQFLNTHIYELNAQGELVNRTIYTTTGSNSQIFDGFTATDDGNYVLIAFENIPFSSDNIYKVIKIDPNGNVIWERAFGENDQFDNNLAKNIIETSNNDLLLVGCGVNNFSTNLAFAQRLNADGIQTPNCDDEQIVLLSQDEVDAWPGCTEIEGTLVIAGDDITDLSPLAGLTKAGFLFIRDCPNLTNLTGLNDLERVVQVFSMVRCPQLSSLAELDNLLSFGNLTLNELPVLTSLEGLESLEEGGSLSFFDCAMLSNLDALGASSLEFVNSIRITDFPSLTSLDFSWHIFDYIIDLNISNNENLTSITGFPQLTSGRGNITIQNNPLLENIDFLSNLGSIGDPFNEFSGDALSIINNNSLTNLDGLQSLSSVGNVVRIIDNENLENLDGLSNLMFVPNLFVSINPNLQSCCGVFPLLSEGTYTNANIINNGSCNSVEDVLNFCQSDDCNASVTLSSQAEVDTWIGCDSIAQNLTISGNDIVDLSPLSNLVHIGNVLTVIDNPLLTSLEGLNNINTIASDITIRRNPALEDISALSNITTTEFQIFIDDNDALQTLNGFENLTDVPELIIQNNDALLNLAALNNVTNARGSILISSNSALQSLDAFNQLSQVNGDVIIAGAEALTSLNAFHNLTSIGAFLIIASNPLLSSIDGFEQLQQVGNGNNPAFTFQIENNISLQNIDAFANLQSVDGDFILQDNPNLNLCCGVYPILDTGTITGNIFIDANGSNCNNAFIIEQTCQPDDCNTVVTLSSQEEVNNWIGCDSIFQQLIISGPDIVDLSPLSSLEYVEGAISINSNPMLESLDGLQNATVGFSFGIKNNDVLTDLSALSGLVTMQGQLSIGNNAQLSSLNGLQNLQSVNDIIIEDNPNLTDLSALNNLQNIGITQGNGFILIINNENLTSINSFNQLTEIDNQLIIVSNPSLTSLDAFENVTSIGHVLVFNENPQLMDISSLSNLTSVEDELVISGNIALSNLNGLQNLTSIGSLTLSDNIVLTDISALDNLQTIDGFINIHGNNELTSLNAFSQITSIPGDLTIDFNNSLENIDGFSNLTSIGGRLDIQNNPNLNECCGIYPVLSITGVTDITISNNAPDCNAINIVFDVCQVDDCNLDVILESQEEVDNWLGCTEILGRLTINGDDIVDLTPLSTLTQVFSMQITFNPLLTTLNGLENITSMGGSLAIGNNPSLTDISALQNITSIEGGFVIIENESLDDLSGLSGLTAVGTNSFNLISDNENLSSLTGLENLTEIRQFNIENNPSLVSISGIANADSLNIVGIFNNPSLLSLEGLEGNTEILSLIISQNTALSNVDGLSDLQTAGLLVLANLTNLTSVQGLQSLENVGDLFIQNNANLTDLNGLENLSSAQSLTIMDNPQLSDCCGIYPLLNEGIVLDQVNIANNPSPCSNQSQVVNFCDDGMLNGSDIELTITPNFTQYSINQDIVFTVEISNTGTETATNIRANAPGWTGGNYNQDVVLTGARNLTPEIPSFYGTVARFIEIPSLAPGQTVRYEVAMYILVEDQTLEFRAQVFAMDGLDIDSSPSFTSFDTPSEDDESLVILTPVDGNTTLADLSLQLSSDKFYINAGEEITYTLTLTNDGPDAASGIRINHRQSSDATYVGHTLNAGEYNPTDAVWTVGNLASGNSVTLNLTLTIDAFGAFPPFVQLSRSDIYFEVISVNENDPDSAPNNTFSVSFFSNEDDEALLFVYDASTQPATSPDLELSLTVDDTEYTLFDYVTYTLTVTNTGDADAGRTKIDWQVPEGLAHHEAIVSSGQYFSWSGEWFIYQGIKAGESESIEFTVWTNVEGVPITSYAQVVEMEEGQGDADSIVGNGTCCTPNEDDEAAVTIGQNFAAPLQSRLEQRFQQLQKIVVHNVYPNPATDNVSFSLTSIAEEEIDYIVYGVQGTAIGKGTLEAGQGAKVLQLDITDYPTGTYYIIFNTNTYHHPVRFVKQQL